MAQISPQNTSYRYRQDEYCSHVNGEDEGRRSPTGCGKKSGGLDELPQVVGRNPNRRMSRHKLKQEIIFQRP